jgi:DNA repair photolyase
MHNCIYCYARDSIYSNYSEEPIVYSNLAQLVEKDLRKMSLCPPISISNITDPCQDVWEVRSEVRRLIQLLMNYGVSFAITTKGDPTFLLDIPGFAEYEPKMVAVTIEGTPEILELISPRAPAFYARLVAVRMLAQRGIRTVIRFDPLFIHLFQAIYDTGWVHAVSDLVDKFAASGARHIIGGTGRLTKKPSVIVGGGRGKSSWQRMYDVIKGFSPVAANKFESEYVYQKSWSGQGYQLRKDLRVEFHQGLREMVESRGLTYASCQEHPAHDSDSRKIPHCHGMPLPFSRRGLGGLFYPISGCTANCHVTCRNMTNPPCGRVELITPEPLKIGKLR